MCLLGWIRRGAPGDHLLQRDEARGSYRTGNVRHWLRPHSLRPGPQWFRAKCPFNGEFSSASSERLAPRGSTQLPLPTLLSSPLAGLHSTHALLATSSALHAKSFVPGRSRHRRCHPLSKVAHYLEGTPLFTPDVVLALESPSSPPPSSPPPPSPPLPPTLPPPQPIHRRSASPTPITTEPQCETDQPDCGEASDALTDWQSCLDGYTHASTPSTL